MKPWSVDTYNFHYSVIEVAIPGCKMQVKTWSVHSYTLDFKNVGSSQYLGAIYI